MSSENGIVIAAKDWIAGNYDKLKRLTISTGCYFAGLGISFATKVVISKTPWVQEIILDFPKVTVLLCCAGIAHCLLFLPVVERDSDLIGHWIVMCAFPGVIFSLHNNYILGRSIKALVELFTVGFISSLVQRSDGLTTGVMLMFGSTLQLAIVGTSYCMPSFREDENFFLILEQLEDTLLVLLVGLLFEDLGGFYRKCTQFSRHSIRPFRPFTISTTIFLESVILTSRLMARYSRYLARQQDL